MSAINRQSGEPGGPENASTPCGHASSGGNASDPRRLSRYERYIQSAAWRTSPARLEELALADGRCRLCARGAPDVRIEIHHRDYTRLGCERPSDLCALCRECHTLVTNELRRRRYAFATLPSLSDTPRVLADRTLTDRTRLA